MYTAGNASEKVTTALQTNEERKPSIVRRSTDVSPTSSTSTLHKTLPQVPYPFLTSQSSPILDGDPSNRHQSLVVVAGNSISLRCSSPAKATFLWSYCVPGCSGIPLIYNGHRIDGSFKLSKRSSVSDCSYRQCTFHVDDMQLDDAGSFSCIVPDVDSQWSVTIFGK